MERVNVSWSLMDSSFTRFLDDVLVDVSIKTESHKIVRFFNKLLSVENQNVLYIW